MATRVTVYIPEGLVGQFENWALHSEWGMRHFPNGDGFVATGWGGDEVGYELTALTTLHARVMLLHFADWLYGRVKNLNVHEFEEDDPEIAENEAVFEKGG